MLCAAYHALLNIDGALTSRPMEKCQARLTSTDDLSSPSASYAPCMAQRVITRLTDDLDGESEASETISFGLDGSQYEIDLTVEHAQDLRDVLNAYIDAARNASPRRVATRRSSGSGTKQQAAGDKPDLNAIRHWARNNGHQVSDRGRISGAIMQEYQASNG